MSYTVRHYVQMSNLSVGTAPLGSVGEDAHADLELHCPTMSDMYLHTLVFAFWFLTSITRCSVLFNGQYAMNIERDVAFMSMLIRSMLFASLYH